MSKIDNKHSFRLLPVLPAQWILLCICWLGQFFIDTRPSELSTLLPTLASRTKCNKQELLSLIGKLSFASEVVHPRIIFLRRLITLSTSAKRLHHHIYLNKESQADNQWWIKFLPTWNQHTIIPESFTIKNSDLQLFTDASNLGFGAIFKNSCIEASWPQ